MRRHGKGWVTEEKYQEIKAKKIAGLEKARAVRDAQKAGTDTTQAAQGGIRGLVRQVWRHLNDKECPKRFSKEAEVLWQVSSANAESKAEFLSKYLPMLAKSEERLEGERGVDEGMKATSKLIEEWLENYKKGQPQ